MTLIVGVLTDGFAILSSDRMITRTQQTEIVAQHESDTKCFVLEKQYVVGYAGVARFGGQRMEEWVAELLSEIPARYRLEALREGIADALHANDAYHEVIAFLGVGYSRNAFGQAKPHAWIISNAVDPATARVSRDYLSVDVRRVDLAMPADGVLVRTIGEPPIAEYVEKLKHATTAQSAEDVSSRFDPLPIVGALAEVTLKSAPERRTIGETVQVTNLPRPENAEEEGMTIWIGPITPGDMAKFTIPITIVRSAMETGHTYALIRLPGGGSITQGRYVPGATEELGPQVDPWAPPPATR